VNLVINKEILPSLAVLLIDMQDYFINSREERQALIPKQVGVIKFCQKNDVPIVVIEYSNFGQTTKRLVDATKRLSPENVYRVIKSSEDAFAETGLQDLLQGRGVKYLLVMGVSTCACVYQTAFHAFQAGFKIITSRDLIEGYREQYKQRILWYGENGPCYDNYKQLLEDLS